jgi:hypothetical protein
MTGMNVNQVRSIIESERNDVECFIVPAGRMVTQDYYPSRVRLFIDRNDNVERIPKCG